MNALQAVVHLSPILRDEFSYLVGPMLPHYILYAIGEIDEGQSVQGDIVRFPAILLFNSLDRFLDPVCHLGPKL